MTITSTAVGFTLSSLGLAFCGIRFLGAFQKIGSMRPGNKIGILLSAYFLSTALQHAVFGIGSLFFAEDPTVLSMVLVFGNALLTIATLIGVYAASYILFPSFSPWIAVCAVSVLGGAVVVLTYLSPHHPFLDAAGGIEWNVSPYTSILLFSLLFFNIGAPFSIFLYSFLHTRSREVKIISLVIVVVTALGLINTANRFLFSEQGLNLLKSRIHDTTLGIIGILCIGAFLLPPVVITWLAKKD